jgi:hypothetical protein
MFEKLFVICVKILIKSKVQLSGFELQTFHKNSLRLRQSKHTRLFHNIEKILFIILYNHYLSKKFRIKKASAKVKISNLINYSTICCRNGKGAAITHLQCVLCFPFTL